MRLWLWGMFKPDDAKQIENDERFIAELNAKEGLGAWERLQEMRYEKHLNPYPEFDTPDAAQLEFMSIVNGKPVLLIKMKSWFY